MCSPQGLQALYGMLTIDPTERLDAGHALHQKFFADVSKDESFPRSNLTPMPTREKAERMRKTSEIRKDVFNLLTEVHDQYENLGSNKGDGGTKTPIRRTDSNASIH